MGKNQKKKKEMNAELIISVIALVVSSVSLFLSTYYSQRGIKTNIRPTLVFVYTEESRWVIRNVGSGPALNVLIAQRSSNDTEWQDPVRIHPLKSDDKIALSWVGINSKMPGATYQDADNTFYTSVCDNDLTTFYDGNQLPKWDEKIIKKQWEL